MAGKKIPSQFFKSAVGYVIVIGVIALITFTILYFQRPPKNSGKYAEYIKSGALYHVTRVIDGDTLVANVAGHELTVRLLGINTPETIDPRKPVECYGPEASVEGKKLLTGKDIYLDMETNRESYDKY